MPSSFNDAGPSFWAFTDAVSAMQMLLPRWDATHCHSCGHPQAKPAQPTSVFLSLNWAHLIRNLASQTVSVVKNYSLAKSKILSACPSKEKKLCDCPSVILTECRELLSQRSAFWKSRRYSPNTHTRTHTHYASLPTYLSLPKPSPCFSSFHLHNQPTSGYISISILWKLK